ncbi:amidohydrolase [Thetidibacter halocola]|uniref:Amidohydrolase n=1 Tax=Thetidibacter halocola TaxID=2827239 RepID=A0A8J8B994_9RHOB|nr:amidohydrolase [Thetidibacter halocola]MBS0125325.1 amidohydrolase [Thetidibacter halocola]
MTPTASADALIAERATEFSDWCALIFEFAEPAWREYRSAEWYVACLRAEGFTVEEGSAGMPTAFCAEWRNGDGPMVGMYAEYDAVPGNCQAARPERAPRDGLPFGAAGHTDPHSALGIGSLAGLLATKHAMQAHGIPGGLRFTGEPAEKVRGSKPLHAAAGYYDGLAGILSFHPFYMLPLCNTVRWDTQCGAAYSFVYRFRCDAPQLWGTGDGAPIPQSHSDVRAPGANDALMLMLSQGRMLRDSMLPHRGGWSVSEAILATGQATADNLPALAADLQYMIRIPDIPMAEAITARLDAIADSAAALAGCTVEKVWVSRSRPGLTNHVMAGIVWDALQEAGPPAWTDEALALARQVQQACGRPPEDNPLIPECTALIAPQEAEAHLRRDLPPSQTNSTSDDYTDMSWHAPTARFYVARPALRGGPYPPWAMNALGGMRPLIDPTVNCAARVLARSALRLLTDAAARRAAWQEFECRRDVAPIPPLADYPPPIALPWPEYVETRRGRGWHIPF